MEAIEGALCFVEEKNIFYLASVPNTGVVVLEDRYECKMNKYTDICFKE